MNRWVGPRSRVVFLVSGVIFVALLPIVGTQQASLGAAVGGSQSGPATNGGADRSTIASCVTGPPVRFAPCGDHYQGYMSYNWCGNRTPQVTVIFRGHADIGQFYWLTQKLIDRWGVDRDSYGKSTRSIHVDASLVEVYYSGAHDSPYFSCSINPNASTTAPADR